MHILADGEAFEVKDYAAAKQSSCLRRRQRSKVERLLGLRFLQYSVGVYTY